MEAIRPIHEKVNFRDDSLLLFYDRSVCQGYPLHHHAALEIIMPVEGGYAVECGGVVHPLDQGDILVLQPNTPHQMAPAAGRRYILLASLQPICNHPMLESVRAVLPPVLRLAPEIDLELHARVRELMYAIGNEHARGGRVSELSKYVSLLQILVLCGRQAAQQAHAGPPHEQEQRGQTHNLLEICEFLHQHYMEKLSLEDMARRSGFSRFHFDRIFKRQTGESFYQYLNGIRIRNAARMLAEGGLSVTEVAFRSGFASISAFIRMFRIHFDCTPTEYRGRQRRHAFETGSHARNSRTTA